MSTGLPLTRERLEQWRDAQPRQWRGAVVPVLLWVLLVVLAASLTEEGGCTVAQPCGPDWATGVEVPVCVAAPVALLWWPARGWILSVVAVLVFLWVERDLDLLPAWLATGLPLVVLVATVDSEVRRRRRTRTARDLLAAVPTASFPGDVPAVRQWPWRLRAGLACAAVAPLLLGYGIVHGRSEAAEERAATSAVGTVVRHGDDGYLITVDLDGGRYDIDSLDADDYPVGSEQRLLVRADGEASLAVERYDPSGWLGGAVGLLLLGLVLGGRAREEREQTRRLLTGPQPVHQVRLAWALRGTQVLPVDDPAAVPLLQLELIPAEPAPVDDADAPEVETATLYGGPLVGGQCAAVLDDGTRLLPLSRPRRGDPAWREQVVDVRPLEGRDDAPAASAGELAAWREELTGPEWWRAPLGSVLVLGSLAGAFVVVRESQGVGTALFQCAVVASFAFDGLVLLVSRVRLTPEALVHDGPTTRRTVPWGAIEGVTVLGEDVVLARLGQQEVLPLTWLPHRPLLGRKSRRRAWARRWAQVLAAEVGRAAGGPARTVTTEPRLHGASVAIAFTVAVLLGLWSRGAP